MSDTFDLEPLARLTRDLKNAAVTLSDAEARFLCDAYYQLQDTRIRSANQVRSLKEAEEPHTVIAWLMENSQMLESSIKRALDAYTNASIVGKWSKTIPGIGPVLAAGLLAHIDITKAPTVGHIWRFAGLDPTSAWNKGEKRPWNARLKVLCWKIGESFVKVSNKDSDIYGVVYLERKVLENERNDQGEFSEQAKEILANKKFRADTIAKSFYEKGQLPPGHIHARAKRYAVKLFLSHWHHVAYEVKYGTPPSKPYVIDHLKHAHFLAPPNWPMVEGKK